MYTRVLLFPSVALKIAVFALNIAIIVSACSGPYKYDELR